jgi:hypothetical protein
LGEILVFYADLRRELERGNLGWGFLKVLVEDPRKDTEEGGPVVLFWGNLLEELPVMWLG